MRCIEFILLPGLFLLSSATPDSFGQSSSLTIRISNVQKKKGKLVVEIYNNPSSWLKNPFQKVVLSTNDATALASFDVPTGKYAVSIYQDINDNGELDRNFLGVPREPVGFGNNYRPFGKPTFEAARIDYGPPAKPQDIKLFEVF
ncbi:DUF2141 domain-containing protein [Larkinella soli]|uniref:DUF2141 domain-containing protein n=1 Tax=Larkinella soli TaxID=1770527 RepID=UPI000FFC390E|nr:DUF2141 domain-containing protein [Larkinella soli]